MTASQANGNGHSDGNNALPLAPLSSSSLFFSPLPPSHTAKSGKASNGRYMLSIPWSKASGWGQPRIEPRREIALDPLAGVLQYAVTCFEGMKCYKDDEGGLRLFRPEENFQRFKRSAKRLGLPHEWDNSELVDLVGKLVSLEKDSIPAEDGANLYLRPTLIETSEPNAISDDPDAEEALLYIITTVRFGMSMYKSAESADSGLKLDANKNYIRAWPGGTGNYKLGANYGPVHVAKQPGWAMSLWLHGEQDLISEAGAMNLFVIKEAQDGVLEFLTMSLDNGLVLPGITRKSIIQLISDHADGTRDFPLPGMPKGVRVVERDISMHEVVAGIQDGSLKGMFGCGTGVVVVSIKQIRYHGTVHDIPYSPLVKLVRDTVTALQRGKVEHEWSYKVPAWESAKALERKTNGDAMAVA